jgi:hypothetical protein
MGGATSPVTRRSGEAFLAGGGLGAGFGHSARRFAPCLAAFSPLYRKTQGSDTSLASTHRSSTPGQFHAT